MEVIIILFSFLNWFLIGWWCCISVWKLTALLVIQMALGKFAPENGKYLFVTHFPNLGFHFSSKENLLEGYIRIWYVKKDLQFYLVSEVGWYMIGFESHHLLFCHWYISMVALFLWLCSMNSCLQSWHISQQQLCLAGRCCNLRIFLRTFLFNSYI